ncbi:hypothetical protein GCM10010313_14920 [Streptomyces violarus]|nr:hypothetical protein GCM10010313_14920 [Streptomyces violarus]
MTELTCSLTQRGRRDRQPARPHDLFATSRTVRVRRRLPPARGLADPAGVSYQSYNYPGRYVRHWEYLLNAQTVSTTTDRADATFYTQ